MDQPAIQELSIKKEEQVVTPWEVSGAQTEDGKLASIDYDILTTKFGTKKIDQDLMDRFVKVTGKPAHRLIQRGMIYSHRDFEMILDRYEKKEPIYLYTGRGPSSDSMHVGHMVPFIFCK